MSKKLFIGLSALALCVCMLLASSAIVCSAVQVTDGQDYYLFGDGNGDGAVDIKDFVRAKRYLADNSSVIIILCATDIDADGEVTAEDLTQYKKNLIGVDNTIFTGGTSWSDIY